MARFQFRLEASLKHAERASEEAQRSLARETQKYLLLFEARDEQKETWLAALEGQRQAGFTNPENLGRWQTYARLQHQLLLEQEAKLLEQEKIKEKMRLQVIRIHQEVEKLKRLKAKQEKAFVLAEQRKEQKILDEAGQVLFWANLKV